MDPNPIKTYPLGPPLGHTHLGHAHPDHTHSATPKCLKIVKKNCHSYDMIFIIYRIAIYEWYELPKGPII